MPVERFRIWAYPAQINDIQDVDSYLRQHYEQHVEESVDRIEDIAKNLTELEDVNITSPADGAGLAWNSASSKWIDSVTAGTDEKASIDSGATPAYIGAASNDGILRTGTSLSYTDGGNYITLDTVQGIGTGDSPTFAGASLGTGELTAGSINRAADTLTLEIAGTPIESITSSSVAFSVDTNLKGSDTRKLGFWNASGAQRAFLQINNTTLTIAADSEIYFKPNNTLALTLGADLNSTFAGNLIIPNAGNIGSVGDTDAIAIATGGEVTLSQTLLLSDVVAAGTDTDKFLVLDASNNVDYRTGANVLSDIGGQASDADLTTLANSTAWRVFYSDGSSVITELALGGNGTFLKSGGASAAPSWDTPTGSGDVSAAANLTDHAIVRGNGGAKGVQTSGIIIDDSDNVSGMGTLSCGAIGINTATPNFDLQLDSTRADAAFDANDLTTWADFKIQGQTATGRARGIYFDFDQDSANDKGAGIVGFSGDPTGGAGGLGFITTSGNTGALVMEITAAGNVEMTGNLNLTSATSTITGGAQLNLEAGATGIYSTTIRDDTGSLTPNMYIHFSTGRMWRDTSALKYKANVEDLELDSSLIYQLRPVSFDNIHKDTKGHPNEGQRLIGLVADEIETIYPELINYGENNEIENYDFKMLMTLMLAEIQSLNGRLKQVEGV